MTNEQHVSEKVEASRDAQQQDNIPLENTTLRYQGKLLSSQGTYSKGPNKGNPWKLYKLSFDNPRPDAQYPIGFKAFRPLTLKSISLDDMKEGEVYELVYKIEPYTNQYGEQKPKRIIIVKPGNPDNIKVKEQTTQTTAPASAGATIETQQMLPSMTDEQINQFIGLYSQRVVPAKQGKTHFIGAATMKHFLINKTMLQRLIKAYEDNFCQPPEVEDVK